MSPPYQARVAPTLLGVFAKFPEPGRVKTRLSPPLAPAEAAALYRAFLADTLERWDRARASAAGNGKPFDLAVVFEPEESRPWFESIAPPGALVLPQRGRDLAARLARFFGDAFENGFRSVLAASSDAPTLPTERSLRALEALAGGADGALVPDAGGGYALLALRRPCPVLFEAMEGPPGEVLRRTLDRARESRKELALLRAWYDVDRPSDLARLARDLRSRPAEAPRTAALLRRLGRRLAGDPASAVSAASRRARRAGSPRGCSGAAGTPRGTSGG